MFCWQTEYRKQMCELLQYAVSLYDDNSIVNSMMFSQLFYLDCAERHLQHCGTSTLYCHVLLAPHFHLYQLVLVWIVVFGPLSCQLCCLWQHFHSCHTRNCGLSSTCFQYWVLLQLLLVTACKCRTLWQIYWYVLGVLKWGILTPWDMGPICGDMKLVIWVRGA